ncbi:MAG TPA: hypothetical protein VIH10_08025, partial [Kribbella sp.]
IMTTPLQQDIDRWEAELDRIAETSAAADWFVEERRLAEAQHTAAAFRNHILPALSTQQPQIAGQLSELIDRLEDLRDELFRTVHPPNCHQQTAETVAAVHALAHLALGLEQPLEHIR